MCRANDPDHLRYVTGGDADQASAPVLNVNCADQFAETALVQAINVGVSWPPASAAMSLAGQTEKSERACAKSPLPSITDFVRGHRHVSNVP